MCEQLSAFISEYKSNFKCKLARPDSKRREIAAKARRVNTNNRDKNHCGNASNKKSGNPEKETECN